MGFSTINIYLNFQSTIFHSKVFQIYVRGKIYTLIGSTNFTKMAFHENEEVLLSFNTNQPSINKYINKVINSSEPIDEVVPSNKSPNSLISFFRNGLLYFKPLSSLQTAYKNLDMPNGLKANLKIFPLPRFADATNPFGPFNILNTLKSGETEEFEEESEKQTRVIISHYSIETSLGYWVPSEYVEILDKQIEKSSLRKLSYLEKVKNEVLPNLDQIKRSFEAYIQDVDKILSEGNHSWRPDSFYKNGFSSFLSNFSKRISDIKYIERCARPFIGSVMPEIWSDPKGFEDFEDSFFESLIYKSTSSPKKQKIVNAFIEKLGAPIPDVPIDLKKVLCNILNAEPWTSENWFPNVSENEEP